MTEERKALEWLDQWAAENGVGSFVAKQIGIIKVMLARHAQLAASRGEANPNRPIDWTLPLRVVGTHERAHVRMIAPEMPNPVLVGWTIAHNGVSVEFWTSRDGKTTSVYDFAVENIPPEPRIVERWMLIPACNVGLFGLTERPKPTPGYCITKILIEETD